MEKKRIEDCSAQYEAINVGFDTTHTFSYRVNGSKENVLQINILSNMPMYLYFFIVGEVKSFIEVGDNDNIYSIKSVLAKEFLDLCTDIIPPVTTEVDEETGESICDYTLCYELVFGRYGIAKYDRISTDFLNEILGVIQDFYLNRIRVKSPVNLLAQKLLDLYELFKYELDDINENPARAFEMMERVIKFPTQQENQEEK